MNKKFLLSVTALSVLLTGCGEEKKDEVETTEEYAKKRKIEEKSIEEQLKAEETIETPDFSTVLYVSDTPQEDALSSGTTYKLKSEDGATLTVYRQAGLSKELEEIGRVDVPKDKEVTYTTENSSMGITYYYKVSTSDIKATEVEN